MCAEQISKLKIQKFYKVFWPYLAVARSRALAGAVRAAKPPSFAPLGRKVLSAFCKKSLHLRK
jgi:hypothetical protein